MSAWSKRRELKVPAWSVGEYRPSGCIKRQIVRGSDKLREGWITWLVQKDGHWRRVAPTAEDWAKEAGRSRAGSWAAKHAPVQPAAMLGANSSKLWQHSSSNLFSLSTLSLLGSLSCATPNKHLEHLPASPHAPMLLAAFSKADFLLTRALQWTQQGSLQPTLHLDSWHKKDRDPEDER